jgi:hypothetical protein
MDSDDYLQSDFDPATITVPRLRSILVTHNVPYQATAKKPQLVTLFNEHVAPRAQRILSDRARLRRTSKGIIDAHGGYDVDDMDPHTLTAPTPRQRSVRRSVSPRKASVPVRVKHEDEPDIDATPVPARSRRSVSRHLASESEDDHGRVSRRMTRRTVTPQIKYEEEDEEDEEDNDVQVRPRTRDEASPFSSENPFQSASSPPDPTKRRKTGGSNVVQSRPLTSGPRISAGAPISTMFAVPRTGTAPAFAHAPSLTAPRIREHRVSDRYQDPEPNVGNVFRVPSESGRTVSRSTQSFQVPVSQLMRRHQPKAVATENSRSFQMPAAS